MRLLSLALLATAALALSACDDVSRKNRPAAKVAERADCCCEDSCPTPPPAAPAAPVVGTLESEGAVTGKSGGHVRRVVHERRTGYRARTGTEGVGYLDEDLAGDSHGYRRYSGTEGVGYLDEGSSGYARGGAVVSVEERETYEERRRYAESGYSYSGGSSYGGSSYEASGYERREGGDDRRHGRRGGGYAGVDRDGYLTWPGKRP